MAVRFQWSEVDHRVIRALLGQLASDDDQQKRLATLSKRQLSATARASYGEPPHKNYTKELVDVAMVRWLPVASAHVVEELATHVQSGLSGPQRTQDISTKPKRIAFLAVRNRTAKFDDVVRKHFIAAHKVHVAAPKGPSKRQSALTPVKMMGDAALAPHSLHQHQLEAQIGLDRLLKARQATPAGVVVLPTGSGKTETAVTWLLEQMERDPTLRVLWVANQQELLQQAATRFEQWARCRPRGFLRVGRVMHSNSYPVSLLASKDLDVAFVTIQSLAADLAKRRNSYLDAFLCRPTIVVVDEAHHAGAPTYSKFFERLQGHKVKAVVGLTATPYPSSILAQQRFRANFPVTVHQAMPEELIVARILARPVLHTVSTSFQIEMTDKELRRAESSDLPSSVLSRLDAAARNELVANHYVNNRALWGKTLLYATSIANANHIHSLLREERANVKVLHSAIEEDRSDVISWFRRAKGEAVLVSVGMLTEGVDLPDARTAFLSRPTTSRVLLKQMIGRVLRGPLAGGEAEANIVYFSDMWRNFSDLLEPPDVLGSTLSSSPPTSTSGAPAGPAGGIIFVEEVPELDTGALGDIRRQFERGHMLPIHVSQLAGFYRLPERTIPVFAHQLDSYENLITGAMEGSLQGRPFVSFFDDTPAPTPSGRSLRDLVDFVRENDEQPGVVSVDHLVGPSVAADRIIAAGPIDDAARADIIRNTYQSTLVSLAYPTPLHFEQAVDQELRSRRERRLVSEQVLRPSIGEGLRKLPRSDRDLTQPTKKAIAGCLRLLPTEITANLDPPAVSWSSRVGISNFAYWTIKLSGKARGKQTIRINRLLRSTQRAVPDDVLSYLIFHELLHHLLPWQGHDAEFRDYESRWPDSAKNDAWFDSLHERWDLTVAKYRNDTAKPDE